MKAFRNPRRRAWLFASSAAIICLAIFLRAHPPYPALGCPCDHTQPQTLSRRVCSLCGTAEEASEPVYFLKDIHPAKPNRYLALPRSHPEPGLQYLGQLSAEERERLWSAAIRKGGELFGDGWGLAHNGRFFRTQCHVHIHIGPLRENLSHTGGELIGGPAGFPATGADEGIWVHPAGEKYCVHVTDGPAESALRR